jgi:diguanylate cyclase (GGDEF)-like protein
MATSPRRLMLMAGAAIAASAVMVTRLLRRGDYGELFLALGATVLFLLVLVGLNSLRRHELIQQALYDPLTSLANRTLFADRLSHALGGAIRHGRPVTVLVMDLNGFKAVNDTFGHAAGDQLLVEIADHLRAGVRPTDTVARLGGDEFAVLLEDAPVADAVSVAERLLEGLRTPIDIEGREVFVDGSIGIAESPSGSISAEALLRDADAAMYTAKRAGKGAYEVFQPEFHVEVLKRFELSTDLRRALAHREFVLHYQPIVTLKEGRIIGVEALIRWMGPDGRLVSPAEFIPVAEQTGLIVPIDRWVMREACRQASAWAKDLPDDQPISMSVNVSVKRLNDAGLAEEVRETLEETGLDASRLTLEITESVLMQDAEATLAILRELKVLGIRLAIDDFGIGFSSLNYLRRLPVDVVKIDRSFVAGIASQSSEWTLARGIIRLVHELGLETVAEGVERADQRAHLRALGCRFAQGFFFARPMEPDAIAELLAKASSRSA